MLGTQGQFFQHLSETQFGLAASARRRYQPIVLELSASILVFLEKQGTSAHHFGS
jgi:hypothetical protein